MDARPESDADAVVGTLQTAAPPLTLAEICRLDDLIDGATAGGEDLAELASQCIAAREAVAKLALCTQARNHHRAALALTLVSAFESKVELSAPPCIGFPIPTAELVTNATEVVASTEESPDILADLEVAELEIPWGAALPNGFPSLFPTPPPAPRDVVNLPRPSAPVPVPDQVRAPRRSHRELVRRSKAAFCRRGGAWAPVQPDSATLTGAGDIFDALFEASDLGCPEAEQPLVHEHVGLVPQAPLGLSASQRTAAEDELFELIGGFVDECGGNGEAATPGAPTDHVLEVACWSHSPRLLDDHSIHAAPPRQGTRSPSDESSQIGTCSRPEQPQIQSTSWGKSPQRQPERFQAQHAPQRTQTAQPKSQKNQNARPGSSKADTPITSVARRSKRQEDIRASDSNAGVGSRLVIDEPPARKKLVAAPRRPSSIAPIEPLALPSRTSAVAVSTSPTRPIMSTNNPSGFKGVYPARNGRWQAQYQHRSIGGFYTAWEAGVAVAKAHQSKARKAKKKISRGMARRV
jgi:hypothetical protein